MEILVNVVFYGFFVGLLGLAVYVLYILEVDKSEARKEKDDE